MKARDHIEKAADALTELVADGHLKDDFELAEQVYLAQFGLQEAKRIEDKKQE